MRLRSPKSQSNKIIPHTYNSIAISSKSIHMFRLTGFKGLKFSSTEANTLPIISLPQEKDHKTKDLGSHSYLVIFYSYQFSQPYHPQAFCVSCTRKHEQKKQSTRFLVSLGADSLKISPKSSSQTSPL